MSPETDIAPWGKPAFIEGQRLPPIPMSFVDKPEIFPKQHTPKYLFFLIYFNRIGMNKTLRIPFPSLVIPTIRPRTPVRVAESLIHIPLSNNILPYIGILFLICPSLIWLILDALGPASFRLQVALNILESEFLEFGELE